MQANTSFFSTPAVGTFLRTLFSAGKINETSSARNVRDFAVNIARASDERVANDFEQESRAIGNDFAQGRVSSFLFEKDGTKKTGFLKEGYSNVFGDLLSHATNFSGEEKQAISQQISDGLELEKLAQGSKTRDTSEISMPALFMMDDLKPAEVAKIKESQVAPVEMIRQILNWGIKSKPEATIRAINKLVEALKS